MPRAASLPNLISPLEGTAQGYLVNVVKVAAYWYAVSDLRDAHAVRRDLPHQIGDRRVSLDTWAEREDDLTDLTSLYED